MSLKRRIIKLGKSIGASFADDDYSAWPIEGDDWATFAEARDQFEQSDCLLLKVRPPKESDSIEAAQQLLDTVHDVKKDLLGFNQSHTHAHEIWYDDGKIQFFFAPQTKIDSKQFIRQVRSNYEDANVSTDINVPWPTLERGDYVSAATLHQTAPFYYPLKSPMTSGDKLTKDPYSNITSDMVVEEAETSDGEYVTAKDCRVVVQTIFEPADPVWSKRKPFGRDVDDIAHSMKQGSVEGNFVTGYYTRDAGSKDKQAAKMIEKQRGKKGYYVTLRVFAISPYKEIAKRRCRIVGNNYRSYHNSHTEQTLEPNPADPGTIPRLLAKGVKREHSLGLRYRRSDGKFLVTIPELASIAHLPDEEINTPAVDWAQESSGPGVPADSPQFEEVRRQQQGEVDMDDDGSLTTLNPGAGGGQASPRAGASRSTDSITDTTDEDRYVPANSESEDTSTHGDPFVDESESESEDTSAHGDPFVDESESESEDASGPDETEDEIRLGIVPDDSDEER